MMMIIVIIIIISLFCKVAKQLIYSSGGTSSNNEAFPTASAYVLLFTVSEETFFLEADCVLSQLETSAD
jgi:hypothetical protein